MLEALEYIYRPFCERVNLWRVKLCHPRLSGAKVRPYAQGSKQRDLCDMAAKPPVLGQT